ncbi:D-alanyl-D-alanine carboxypeptidase [Jeotgalicoccus aerolatus]|jgi:zinc D-Ala-D-Ala carboxypeptidase|uniref:D-alanyl-D-alanine carboxypeptidase n=1 Tax=Jeotgalicoccus aerolatus TaxID=709510 RepID=A0ABS4HPG4_9STAP|nr:M15 family metallopeptidase [Jeotgalicoccus aerolatus]MBP1952791.1 D-alanyl-D-alanine carboxypeptidase [Jeotgalicoccus aerolatus]GGE08069.1 D-Ala-D-Ala carboxypeptidase [Jeotgalicoccus aerolatus]CAD2080740.1 D-alanyl-D-alanine carboxypeptidase [Jeotgalicoccus aerolatus]HJG33872.1 M15 family metallopeptidase [Jeotgalicoccus aerolatus]
MKLSKLIIAGLLMSALTACSSEEPAVTEAVNYTKTYEPLTFSNLDIPVNIEVIDGITYANGVLIVNKEIPLPEDYNPEMQPEVIEAYTQMFEDGAAEGLNFELVSGFRSYDYQAELYNNYVSRDGKEAADRYSAEPGHSEHQTGLAIDVGSYDSAVLLQTSFEYTPEFQWMKDVAHEYGFIIRYMKGKEDITGYMYEPWHLRYVGDKATEIYESGLTLEEYFGLN